MRARLPAGAAKRTVAGSLSWTEIVGDGARASIVRAHGQRRGFQAGVSAQICGAQS